MSDQEAFEDTCTAFNEIYDIILYARRLNKTPEGRVRLRAVCENVHNTLAWCQKRDEEGLL